MSPADRARIDAIAPKAAVIPLSFDALKRAQGTVRCWYPAGVLEPIAQAAEGQLNLDMYHPPLLVGRGAGAAFIYASLVAAPEGTFIGGVGFDVPKTLPTDRPLCNTRTWKPAFLESDHASTLPPADLGGLWTDLSAAASSAEAIDAAVASRVTAEERTTSKATPPTATTAELEKRLQALGFSLDDTWAAQPKATLIFVSGDGGWKDIDRSLAAYLQPRGGQRDRIELALVFLS